MKKIHKHLLITTLATSILLSTTIPLVSCVQNSQNHDEKQINLNKTQQESIKEFTKLNQEIVKADLDQFTNDLLNYINNKTISSNTAEINNLNFDDLNKTISFDLNLNFLLNNKTYKVLINYQNIKIEPILVEHNAQVFNSWKISGNNQSKIISKITFGNKTITKENSNFLALQSNFYNQFNYKLFFDNIISENDNLGLFYINTSNNSKQLTSADLLPTPTKIEEVFTVDNNWDQPNEDNMIPMPPIQPETPSKPQNPTQPSQPLPPPSNPDTTDKPNNQPPIVKPEVPDQPTLPNDNSNIIDNTNYIGPELALNAYNQLFNTKISVQTFKSDLTSFQAQLNSYLTDIMTNYKYNNSDLKGELQKELSTFQVEFKNISQTENHNKKYFNFEIQFNCKIVLKDQTNQIKTNNIVLNVKYDKIALLPIVIKKGRTVVSGGYRIFAPSTNNIHITRTFNNKTTQKTLSARLNDIKVYPEYSKEHLSSSFIQYIFNNNARSKLLFWMESNSIKKQFNNVQKIPNRLDNPLK